MNEVNVMTVAVEANPVAIRNEMMSELRKSGEVQEAIQRYFTEKAEDCGYDTLIEFIADAEVKGSEAAKALNTARLELYAPFKCEGYDVKGSVEKVLYDRIAKRYSRLKKSILDVIHAMDIDDKKPEVETCETPADETPETENEGCEISKTEDELYARFTSDLNALCSKYCLDTDLTNSIEAVVETAVLHLQAQFLNK